MDQTKPEPDLKPEDILEAGIKLLTKKEHDYTKDGSKNRYENFEKSAVLISWFDDPIDKAFASLIGTKLARLSALLNKDEEPNNESLQDTFIDLSNYSALWGANREYRRRKKEQKAIDDKNMETYRAMTNVFPLSHLTMTGHTGYCDLARVNNGGNCTCISR